MKIGQALRWATARLAASPSPRLDAELLLARVRGCGRAGLLASLTEDLGPAEFELYREMVRRRARGEPVAYLLGNREFMSLEFELGPGVFIPRPETEVLVEESGRRLSGRPAQVAEAGTGCGAIAISLAFHYPRVMVHATDSSETALATARRNALRHGVADRVFLYRGDHLQPLMGLAGSFHAVVANPPYIPSAVIDHLPPEVRDHEPRAALDGGPDGLQAYRTLAPQAARLLAPGGWMGVEVGPDQAPEVAAILQEAGFGEASVVADLAGRPRAVFAAVRR